MVLQVQVVSVGAGREEDSRLRQPRSRRSVATQTLESFGTAPAVYAAPVPVVEYPAPAPQCPPHQFTYLSALREPADVTDEMLSPWNASCWCGLNVVPACDRSCEEMWEHSAAAPSFCCASTHLPSRVSTTMRCGCLCCSNLARLECSRRTAWCQNAVSKPEGSSRQAGCPSRCPCWKREPTRIAPSLCADTCWRSRRAKFMSTVNSEDTQATPNQRCQC